MRVFHVFILYIWYQIAQRTTHVFIVLKFPFTKIWTTLRSLKTFSSGAKHFNKINSLCMGFTFNFPFKFFSIWVFFHDDSRFRGQQGKGKAMSLTPLYHFHPLHRHLDISREVTTKISLQHIGSSRTWTGHLWLQSASHSNLSVHWRQLSNNKRVSIENLYPEFKAFAVVVFKIVVAGEFRKASLSFQQFFSDFNARHHRTSRIRIFLVFTIKAVFKSHNRKQSFLIASVPKLNEITRNMKTAPAGIPVYELRRTSQI